MAVSSLETPVKLPSPVFEGMVILGEVNTAEAAIGATIAEATAKACKP